MALAATELRLAPFQWWVAWASRATEISFFFYSATPIETDRCIASPVYAMISSPTITLHRRQWNSQQFNDQLDQPRPTAPVALYANQVGTRMYEIKTSVPLIGNKQASRWRTWTGQKKKTRQSSPTEATKEKEKLKTKYKKKMTRSRNAEPSRGKLACNLHIRPRSVTDARLDELREVRADITLDPISF